jgi:hypothetical protein
MTEAEWFECREPQKMLDWLRTAGKLSDRKARLFAVACCRRIWRLLGDERSRRAVEVAECYADGRANLDEVNQAGTALVEALPTTAGRDQAGGLAVLYAVSIDPVPGCSYGQVPAVRAIHCVGYASQVPDEPDSPTFQQNLLRDLLGPFPFREVSIDPAWLTWSGGTVKRLAEAAYEERELPSGRLDPVRLTVLADALEEAGCTEAGLLDHLRGSGFHVRGCHVLDALLGKS